MGTRAHLGTRKRYPKKQALRVKKLGFSFAKLGLGAKETIPTFLFAPQFSTQVVL